MPAEKLNYSPGLSVPGDPILKTQVRTFDIEDSDWNSKIQTRLNNSKPKIQNRQFEVEALKIHARDFKLEHSSLKAQYQVYSNIADLKKIFSMRLYINGSRNTKYKKL